MGLTIERFAKVRPFLYHLTAAGNIASLRATRCLEPTAALRDRAKSGTFAPTRRLRPEVIEVDGRSIHIRDQNPLHAGSIAFEDGWDLNRLVAHIDSHVFFWPGTARGPVEYGLNHYGAYADEGPSLLRMPLASVLTENPTAVPLFSAYNSGSPRMRNGRSSPRGPRTYLPVEDFERSSDDVGEVVFASRILLPSDVEVAEDYAGPWAPLFGSGPSQ